MVQFRSTFLVVRFLPFNLNSETVKCFLAFSCEMALKISQVLLLFVPTHGNCAATESRTRRRVERPNIEERARPQNCVVHKPFACKENRTHDRSWPLFFSLNERVFVSS